MAVASSPAVESDPEQEYLQLHYAYENYLGVRMDTMCNLSLYQEIYGWLGVPYSYSGESKNGTDCSGFVSNIYHSVFHRALASSSRDMYRQDVIPVAKSELNEGDLVFFRIRRRGVSHVGIYLGGNLFVHASRGNGVIISSLEETYYSRYFYSGGRIKP